MARTTLVISGPGTTREVPLRPRGTTIGREANCDIVLEHSSVSRQHARIYQDPFGRWIVEDLDSRNGVIVDGQQVKAQAISPGQKIFISFFALSLSEKPDRETAPGTAVQGKVSVVDKGVDESIVSHKAGKTVTLSPARMQHLNEFTARLMELSSPSELYSRACLRLAGMLNTLVAVVRLPRPPRPLPASPEILACHFGGTEMTGEMLETTNLNLSKRVLDAIRTEDAPVMASSGASSDKNMTLTIIDEHRPHLVFAARVNTLGDTVDALYLDILESRSPFELFDFIEAVARQINFIQKNLLFVELEKKEKALREANAQLKEKDRIKDEYVARVTHDIKGHLAAITSCLYVAGAESSGPLNDKQSDFLGRASRRTTQLTDFVKELLNLTQMRLSGHVKMETFSLHDTISKSLEAVARKAEDKSITVTSRIDPSIGDITGDEFSVNEMITNLLFNAVKYTPGGKTVHLEAACRDDGHVQIDITDTGIGIPADEVGNVFDEFFRATNAKKSEKDGTGLGLSLVKQIVERHGGTISVESEEGRGSTFTVVLPKSD
ncbi:MAG TPA: ATP-binding protein [Patescibacteria group bacterium]|nr:ATP-binding protein [Patescibacteria group bacterium]